MEWSAWPILLQRKAAGNQLVVKSNAPQGQHMHLRHITCITQKPQVAAALLHKYALEHSTAHPPNVAFLLFYQDFRRFPFSGSEVRLLARTCPYIKRGGCKAGIAERHRTATQQDEIGHAVGALGVIDKLRRQPGRVINKQADNN